MAPARPGPILWAVPRARCARADNAPARARMSVHRGPKSAPGAARASARPTRTAAPIGRYRRPVRRAVCARRAIAYKTARMLVPRAPSAARVTEPPRLARCRDPVVWTGRHRRPAPTMAYAPVASVQAVPRAPSAVARAGRSRLARLATGKTSKRVRLAAPQASARAR